jgi:hypothetical protein
MFMGMNLRRLDCAQAKCASVRIGAATAAAPARLMNERRDTPFPGFIENLLIKV